VGNIGYIYIFLSLVPDLPGHGVMLLHHAVADALPSLLGPAAIRLVALARGGAHVQLIRGPFSMERPNMLQVS